VVWVAAVLHRVPYKVQVHGSGDSTQGIVNGRRTVIGEFQKLHERCVVPARDQSGRSGFMRLTISYAPESQEVQQKSAK